MNQTHCSRRAGAERPLVACVVFALAWLAVPASATAWETRTHQQITEAAWNFIKGKAAGDTRFGDPNEYPTQTDCARAVTYFQNMTARPCSRLRECQCLPLAATSLKEYPVSCLSTPSGGALQTSSYAYVPAEGIFKDADRHKLPSAPGTDPGIDGTGTVLGYWAGLGDYVNDTFVDMREEGVFIGMFIEIGVLAAITGYLLAAACATLTSGAATYWCAGALTAVAGVGVDALAKELEGAPMGPATAFLGHNMTSLWHYRNLSPYNPMAPDPGHYDDRDGFALDYAFQKVGLESFGADLTSWVQLNLRSDMSAATISTYNVNAEDGRPGSSLAHSQSHYWDNNDIFSVTFSPVDNLLRGHWENWIMQKAQRQTDGREVDLVFLGMALHGMQDLLAAQHALSVLKGGNHTEYEQHVERNFDRSEQVRRGGGEPNHTVMVWAGTTGVFNVSEIARILRDYVAAEINDPTNKPPFIVTRNDLPVRAIGERLADEVMKKHSDDDLNMGIAVPWKTSAKRPHLSYQARTAVRMAIAGTVALLVHSAKDVSDVGLFSAFYPMTAGDSDGDTVANHEDLCPLTPGALWSASNPLPCRQGHPCPVPGCPTGVELQSATQDQTPRQLFATCLEAGLLPDYEVFSSTGDGAQYLAAIGRQRAICEGTALGRQNGSEDDRILAYQQRYTLMLNLLQSGDGLAYQKEMACLHSSYPDVFPRVNQTRASARCQCTLDTDGDGVSECDDECPATSQGASVDQVGCHYAP